MNLSFFIWIRLFINLFKTQLTVGCDTLILSFAEFRKISEARNFNDVNTYSWTVKILSPWYFDSKSFCKSNLVYCSQIHREKEKTLTQSLIKKVNPNDVTVSITVTFKIHSEKYNLMEYWLGNIEILESAQSSRIAAFGILYSRINFTSDNTKDQCIFCAFAIFVAAQKPPFFTKIKGCQSLAGFLPWFMQFETLTEDDWALTKFWHFSSEFCR